MKLKLLCCRIIIFLSSEAAGRSDKEKNHCNYDGGKMKKKTFSLDENMKERREIN
jgi:hypothetical protein